MSMRLLRRLVAGAALLTLCVVVLGAYVRLSDAGLGCPDWPGCYGQLTVPDQVHELQAAQLSHPDKPVDAPKAWKEMVHRYFASTLGLLIVLIAVASFRLRRRLSHSPLLPGMLVGVVIFQGLLGMWTVTLLLKPAVVTAHLMGGMTILGLLCWLALRQWAPNLGRERPLPRDYRIWAGLALLAVAMQIVLGGWVSSNYAALACPDFPTCRQSWLPEMHFNDAFHVFRELGMTAQGTLLTQENLVAIHWMHRAGAVLVTLLVGSLALVLLRDAVARAYGVLLLGVLLLQLSLGIANVLLQLPLPVAVGHNAGAALLLLSLVLFNYRTWNKGNYQWQTA